MFRKVGFLVFACVLLASLVSADVHIVYPVDKSVEAGGSVHLGEVSPGQEFTISISPKAFYGERTLTADLWDKLEVLPGLPSGWVTQNSAVSASVLAAKIRVPKTAASSQYTINLRASDIGNDMDPNEFSIVVVVVPGLTRTSLVNPVQTVDQGGSVDFTVSVLNNSLADDEVLLTTDLPSLWTSEVQFLVPPLQNKNVSFKVSPVGSGEKKFKVFLYSLKEGARLAEFDAKIVTNTTLKGSLTAGNEGPVLMPVFLMPFYNLLGVLFSVL